MFQNLNHAKRFAKINAPKNVELGGCILKVGVVYIETPIGKIMACVDVIGASGSGSKRPSVQVVFKDGDGGRHSQKHLQNLIDKALS